jgi:thioredoxin-related protein
MAGLIVIAIVFFAFKRSNRQASIQSPENRVSNFLPADPTPVQTASFEETDSYFGNSDQELVHWMSFNEAYKQCKVNPRPIIVDVYTTWCGPCKMMSAQTFNQPHIAEYINKNFYAVKFNAESKDSVLFDTYVFTSSDPGNPKSPHQFALSILDNQLAYPSVVFLNNQIQRLDIVKGFFPPESFEPILKYYGSGDYQKNTWEEYKSNFVSGLK